MSIARQFTLVEWHQRRYAALEMERNPYIEHWIDLADHLLPRRGRFLQTGAVRPERGGKVNQKIIDSTGTHALNILVSGLASGVTSPARKWFTLVPPDPELRQFGPVKEWLDRVERIMYDIFRASNLYQVLPSVYEELALFGTGALFQQSHFDTVTTFGSFTAGEYVIAADHDGKVRTVYRELPMTVKQIVDKYGDRKAGPNTRWKNFSPAVKQHYDQGNYEVWISTTHALLRNENHVPGSRISREFPYEQVVYETGQKNETPAHPNGQPLHRGGFRMFPVHTPRWHLLTAETWGRSPAMDALGDVKQLQDMEKKKGLALAKHVNPPMLAASALKNERMTTLPGDVTFSDDLSERGGFRPTYQTQPRLADFNQDAESVRARIRRSLYSDLFLIITERPGIQPLNESEIFERKEEKLLALGPVMERMDDDMLEPVIDNTFSRVMETGIAGPPPPELEGQELNVEYLNIIAMAQRAQGLLGMQDTAAFVGSIAQAQAASGQEVTAWDKFDSDKAIDEYAEKRGVPAGIIRDSKAVETLRGDRVRQQQQDRALAAGTELAGAAKDLSDVATPGSNLARDLGPGAGQGPGLQVVQ